MATRAEEFDVRDRVPAGQQIKVDAEMAAPPFVFGTVAVDVVQLEARGALSTVAAHTTATQELHDGGVNQLPHLPLLSELPVTVTRIPRPCSRGCLAAMRRGVPPIGRALRGARPRISVPLLHVSSVSHATLR